MTITTSHIWPLPSRLPDLLAAAASAYAAAGIPVFPCVPGGKRPLTPHGFHDATTDPAVIASWWARFPDANIGVPTGGTSTGSNLDVLDIDVHATGTGFPILTTLHREGLIAGWGQAVRSPSGGLHLYYPADQVLPQPSWSRGRAHVDFRGAGGYIVAPPSSVTTDRGERPYKVIARGLSPQPVDAEAIRAFLTPTSTPCRASGHAVPAPRKVALQSIVDWVAALPEGNRNAGLFWAACRLAETGHTEDDTTSALAPAGQHAGLGDREITSTIRSAHRSTHLIIEPGDTEIGETVTGAIANGPAQR